LSASSVQGAGRLQPETASRAAYGSGIGAAPIITALGLAGLPCRGKANPDSPREHPGREGPACGRHPDRDAALPRARHMAPLASSTRDQHAAGWKGGAER
jgi:hypothetical protein